MNTNYIEFKKKRELGDILSDTFAFLRQEGKSLFSILLKTAAPVIVLFVIALGFMTYTYTDFIGSLGVFPRGSNLESFNTGIMVVSVILLFFAAILFYGILYSTILYYIKSYIATNGAVNVQDVRDGVKKGFLKIIGLSLMANLITVFGFFLCVFPGIYLYVPMSLVFSILVFRNVSTTDAISDSFELIKNEWWMTFATLFVLGIIGSLIGFVFAIPGFIYGIVKEVTMATESSYSDLSNMTDWIGIVLSVVGDLVRYFVVYLLTAISSAFIYFNLNEIKHATGALEQINSLGDES